MAGSKAKTEGMRTVVEKNGKKINEILKELTISEDKIREINEGKAFALITSTNLSDVSVSEHVPPPYHHYPMAELQALKVDPNLDCSPLRRPTAPPAAAEWVTQSTTPAERLPATRPKSLILQKKRAREDRLSEEEEDYANVPETPLDDNKDEEEEELMMRRTPQVKRKRPLTRQTVKREEKNVTAQMIEVSGPDGPMMVFRPWTALEAKKSMAHLPDVNEGGDKLSTELTRFCEELSPTTAELRRLLLSKLGPSNCADLLSSLDNVVNWDDVVIKGWDACDDAVVPNASEAITRSVVTDRPSGISATDSIAPAPVTRGGRA
ncbi:RNA-directed DNA polymerase from transposon X-element [Labeo rohita]|uniref:RNA-directed DNA polymerase from transposon X-element n=1 Tax=Labeo rohita TaxID=84645 RepID=A0A498MKX3_LABRO|nr:RNA-directed DNA polymerase from transposon X-element [Labeo rohita]